jgi:hypothetical protein
VTVLTLSTFNRTISKCSKHLSRWIHLSRVGGSLIYMYINRYGLASEMGSPSNLSWRLHTPVYRTTFSRGPADTHRAQYFPWCSGDNT